MKIYSLLSKLCILFAIVLLTACAEETKKASDEATSNALESNEIKKEYDTYYVWVDNINVRDVANTKGKIVGTYTNSDLKFTGNKSDTKDEIVLRSVMYNSPWLEVTTNDGKKGWIFGGAVKKEGDDSANDIITKDKFNFPHFGSFDLKSWSDLGITRSESGDAATVTSSYMKGDKIIEIEKTEVGEYGYYNTYRLMDSKRKLLKERKFSFTAAVSENDRVMELTETVNDYTTNKQYTRNQKVNKHFVSLNARPQMVNGSWKITPLESETTTETALNKKTAFARPMQVITSLNNMPPGFGDGCDCTFRTHPKDYDTLIVFGTVDSAPNGKVFIKINGEYIILKGKKPENPDYKRGDEHRYYSNDKYDLKFTLTKEPQTETENIKYAGTMHLTSKDGSVDTDINIFGRCGC